MGHRRRSEFGGCRSKTEVQNNNEPPCPRKFLTQPTEFEKSGVLQHPLANPSARPARASRIFYLRQGRPRTSTAVGVVLYVDGIVQCGRGGVGVLVGIDLGGV